MLLPNPVIATICNSYNPLLLLVCLAICIYEFRKGNKLYPVAFVGVVVLAYAFMFLEKFTHLWSLVGLDFSTHADTSLGMVIFIALWGSKTARILAPASFLVYCWLMTVMNYHSWADIGSTTLVMGLVFGVYFTLIKKLLQKTN